jgi:hypothetical protein
VLITVINARNGKLSEAPPLQAAAPSGGVAFEDRGD